MGSVIFVAVVVLAVLALQFMLSREGN